MATGFFRRDYDESLIMALLDKPIIKYFRATPDEVMANDEVMLEWEVENAGKIKLDGFEVDAKGQYALFINDTRNFELVASNWKGKESEIATVRLHRPIIQRFAVEENSVIEGKPVKIDFVCSKGQSWRITADYSLSSGNKKETIAAGDINNGADLFSHTISPVLKGACVLMLTVRNGWESALSEPITLYARNLSVELYANQAVVKRGSAIRISWKALNANRVILNPGNIDVTAVTYYDITAQGDHDMQVEIKAFGDFGQQASATRTIYLAKINHISVLNNGDAANPAFYLSWSATGLHNLELLPENVPVNENEIGFRIPASNVPVDYTLKGYTHNGEEVSETITLKPCSVQHFSLEKGKVIIGTMATLVWQVHNLQKLQLKFSDSPGIIDIPRAETKYHFQVFKGRDKVKLIAWGDINVIEKEEIPIQAFESPQITRINLPSLSLRLGISWISSPVFKPKSKASQSLPFINSTTRWGNDFHLRLLRFMSYPSGWLLRTNQRK